MTVEQAKMEKAFDNFWKSHDEWEKERESMRLKALGWYTENWEKVSDKYWEEYGETLGKGFCTDNLPEDELADFIIDNFEEELWD